MRRVFFILMLVGLFAMAGAPVARVSAQEMKSEPGYDAAGLGALGYPEITIAVSDAGVDAPASLHSGIYLVTLKAEGTDIAYVDFMQPPAGLSAQEMQQQALDAAANDLVRPGWVFAGGGNTFAPGEPVSFLIELTAGDYQIAASHYPSEGQYDIAKEKMRLTPLTVSDAATPAAGTTAAPTEDVTVTMTDDLTYVVTPGTLPAGPLLWKITNAGTMHSHHMVMFKIPDGVTAADIVADFTSLMSGTPTAEPPLMSQFAGVGYAALQSGGRTTWNAFDLKAGTYALICYISDADGGMPHVLGGMATVVTVS